MNHRYPRDLWRWKVGGRNGYWACDLYRVPTDGSQDTGTYGTVTFPTRKLATEVCGWLNQSLSAGGKLGKGE